MTVSALGSEAERLRLDFGWLSARPCIGRVGYELCRLRAHSFELCHVAGDVSLTPALALIADVNSVAQIEGRLHVPRDLGRSRGTLPR